MLYALTNLSQLGQVGVEIITPGKTDIWGPEQDKNTLISFPNALQPLPQLYFKGTLDSLEWVSPHILPSWTSLLCMPKNSSLFTWLMCFLLVSPWVPVAVWAQTEGSLVEGQKISRLYCLLCTSCPIGGAMTSRSSCCAPSFELCLTLFQGLYLKTF